MAAAPFLDDIATRVLVCDGAMGTMLYARGAFVNRAFEELNETQPELVSEIHRAYVAAGADVLETNTFGANGLKLTEFGLDADAQALKLNRAGVRLARAAAGAAVHVAGAIGPLGVRLAPGGRTSVAEAERIFREHAVGLLEECVDLVMLETFRRADELAAAVRAVRAESDLPVVAQLTTAETGETDDGLTPPAAAQRLIDSGATVLGVNCSAGPAPMLEIVQRLADVVRVPLAAQPNAGLPRKVEGRTLYLSSPDFVGSYARRFVTAGVRLVGGCCGTTPEHIRQIASAVRGLPCDGDHRHAIVPRC